MLISRFWHVGVHTIAQTVNQNGNVQDLSSVTREDETITGQGSCVTASPMSSQELFLAFFVAYHAHHEAAVFLGAVSRKVIDAMCTTDGESTSLFGLLGRGVPPDLCL